LSSLFYEHLNRLGDQEGFLLGESTQHVTETITDSHSNSEQQETIISVSSFLSCKNVYEFYNSSGSIDIVRLQSILGVRLNEVIGWYRFRRNTSVQVQLREKHIHHSLCQLLPHFNPLLFCVFNGSYSPNEATHTFDNTFYRWNERMFVSTTVSVINLGNTAHAEYKLHRQPVVNSQGNLYKSLLECDSSACDDISNHGTDRICTIKRTTDEELVNMCRLLNESELRVLQLTTELDVLRSSLASTARLDEEQGDQILVDIESPDDPKLLDHSRIIGRHNEHDSRSGGDVDWKDKPVTTNAMDIELGITKPVKQENLIDVEIADILTEMSVAPTGLAYAQMDDLMSANESHTSNDTRLLVGKTVEDTVYCKLESMQLDLVKNEVADKSKSEIPINKDVAEKQGDEISVKKSIVKKSNEGSVSSNSVHSSARVKTEPVTRSNKIAANFSPNKHKSDIVKNEAINKPAEPKPSSKLANLPNSGVGRNEPLNKPSETIANSKRSKLQTARVKNEIGEKSSEASATSKPTQAQSGMVRRGSRDKPNEGVVRKQSNEQQQEVKCNQKSVTKNLKSVDVPENAKSIKQEADTTIQGGQENNPPKNKTASGFNSIDTVTSSKQKSVSKPSTQTVAPPKDMSKTEESIRKVGDSRRNNPVNNERKTELSIVINESEEGIVESSKSPVY